MTKLGQGQMVLSTEFNIFLFISILIDIWEATATKREKMEQPKDKKKFPVIKNIVVTFLKNQTAN